MSGDNPSWQVAMCGNQRRDAEARDDTRDNGAGDAGGDWRDAMLGPGRDDAGGGGATTAGAKPQDGDAICPECGEAFGSPNARNAHMQVHAGDDAGDDTRDAPVPEPETAADIPAAVGRLSEEQAEAVADELGRGTRAPSDASWADAAAKALVRAMGGEKSQYVAAFGECPHDGCERGRNGLHADACATHDGDADSDESGADAPDDAGNANGDTGAMTRAQYEAALVAEGKTPTEAAEIAEERF